MAKWARRSGGRRRWQWQIEPKPITPEVKTIPDVFDPDDPFTFDSPEAIVAVLWRFEQRKMLEEKSAIADC